MVRCSLFALALLGALGLAGVARAEGPAAELGAAVEGGAAFGLAQATYRSSDSPARPESEDERTRWGLAGALELTGTFAVAGPVRLGGLLRLELADAPAGPFVSGSDLLFSFGVGPALRVESEGDVRWFFGAWLGLASTPSVGGVGVGGGAEVGVRGFVSPELALGLGAGVSTRWVFYAEDGDRGRYDFTQGAIVPGLRVRVDVAL